jgi:pyruvate formate lyase activating enzyme
MSLPIKGVQKLSLIDYPGKLCATIFLGGCNFRCPYCYNTKLVLEPDSLPGITEREILGLLMERRGFLDGLCVGGGEPTIHRELPQFLYKVKSLGLLVKLDTNGSRPGMLEELLERRLVDYVAMDIKVPLRRYREVVGREIPLSALDRSIKLLRRGQIDYEFRTTVVPGVVSEGDLLEIADFLKGSKRYVIQQFRPVNTLNPFLTEVKPYPKEELQRFREEVFHYFGECKIRL